LGPTSVGPDVSIIGIDTCVLRDQIARDSYHSGTRGNMAGSIIIKGEKMFKTIKVVGNGAIGTVAAGVGVLDAIDSWVDMVEDSTLVGSAIVSCRDDNPIGVWSKARTNAEAMTTAGIQTGLEAAGLRKEVK